MIMVRIVPNGMPSYSASIMHVQAGMRQRTISDRPKEQVNHYSRHQRYAFLKAFGSALLYRAESRALRLRGASRKDARAKSWRTAIPQGVA
ncbi:MAG TPA: hypothetical protein VES36_07810 [Candidatus Limnocylindrales bacterium]|nr:hypothetical protein [Candidatus Limnocylindrales bacterium]